MKFDSGLIRQERFAIFEHVTPMVRAVDMLAEVLETPALATSNLGENSYRKGTKFRWKFSIRTSFIVKGCEVDCEHPGHPSRHRLRRRLRCWLGYRFGAGRWRLVFIGSSIRLVSTVTCQVAEKLKTQLEKKTIKSNDFNRGTSFDVTFL